jgi:hypothetical protein
VLLGRAEGKDDPIVSREIFLQLHPVELMDVHADRLRIERDDCYTHPRAAA